MLAIRKLIILCSMMLAGIFPVIVAGCDRESKHRILTFFFEGVPPLDGGKEAVDPNATTTVDESLVAGAGKKPISTQPKQFRIVKHDPVNNCNKCHLGGMKTGQRQLVKPVPDLCYSCHPNYNERSGYLHGPIAVGECVFCHDPHRSKFVHLQKAPQPRLCYQCHIQEDMEFIAGHGKMLDTVCTDCHDPHISSTRNLLRPYSRGKKDPNDVNLSN